MSDFWVFRTMITPALIQIIFWIGAITSCVAGIISIIMGLQSGNSKTVLWGFMLAVVGPLSCRICCEILIVLFRINATLTEIKHLMERREPEPTWPEAA